MSDGWPEPEMEKVCYRVFENTFDVEAGTWEEAQEKLKEEMKARGVRVPYLVEHYELINGLWWKTGSTE